jgi:HAD superfamily hydrolase (TIGR01509 family)
MINLTKALIFDFDGTLADSNHVWAKVDEEFFAKRGMAIPPEYYDKISTLNFYDGAVFTKQAYGITESIEEIMSEWNESAEHEYRLNVQLKPHAKEYLLTLKKTGIKIGLATASNPQYYRPVLERYGLGDFFDAYADGSDKVRGKNFPDLYLLCAERLGVQPTDCTVFEDITKCIQTAKSIGMKTVAVFDKHNPSWEKAVETADYCITEYTTEF